MDAKKKKQLQTHITWTDQQQLDAVTAAAKKETEPVTTFVKKAAVKRAQETNKDK
jgi:uncharacterized protein (DUF1778 family)